MAGRSYFLDGGDPLRDDTSPFLKEKQVTEPHFSKNLASSGDSSPRDPDPDPSVEDHRIRSELSRLLRDIQLIQEILQGTSLGQMAIGDKEQEYKSLYRKLDDAMIRLTERGILVQNPNPHKTLWGWYRYYKDKLPSYASRRQYVDELYSPIVDPVERELAKAEREAVSDRSLEAAIAERFRQSISAQTAPHGAIGMPPQIGESLVRFRADNPDPSKMAFIMMRFGNTPAHEQIVDAVRTTLAPLGINGVRADDKEYADDLFSNILTYMHGCGFGIAVFERIEADDFNPNVSLEVGYMLGLGKSVCLLKEKTLRTLPADLVGRLYKVFDLQNITGTLPTQLSKWLTDRSLI